MVSMTLVFMYIYINISLYIYGLGHSSGDAHVVVWCGVLEGRFPGTEKENLVCTAKRLAPTDSAPSGGESLYMESNLCLC